MAIFCRFSSLDDLTAKDWRDYAKVKAVVLKVGRFSCFEINTPTQCKQIAALCRDPEIVTDHVNFRFPWTGVRKRLVPTDFSESKHSRSLTHDT